MTLFKLRIQLFYYLFEMFKKSAKLIIKELQPLLGMSLDGVKVQNKNVICDFE